MSVCSAHPTLHPPHPPTPRLRPPVADLPGLPEAEVQRTLPAVSLQAAPPHPTPPHPRPAPPGLVRPAAEQHAAVSLVPRAPRSAIWPHCTRHLPGPAPLLRSYHFVTLPSDEGEMTGNRCGGWDKWMEMGWEGWEEVNGIGKLSSALGRGWLAGRCRSVCTAGRAPHSSGHTRLAARQHLALTRALSTRTLSSPGCSRPGRASTGTCSGSAAAKPHL